MVLVTGCLQIVFNRNLLTYVLTPIYLTVPSLTNQFQLLNVLLLYQEIKTAMLL